jgi:hypothetical protein
MNTPADAWSSRIGVAGVGFAIRVRSWLPYVHAESHAYLAR